MDDLSRREVAEKIEKYDKLAEQLKMWENVDAALSHRGGDVSVRIYDVEDIDPQSRLIANKPWRVSATVLRDALRSVKDKEKERIKEEMLAI